MYADWVLDMPSKTLTQKQVGYFFAKHNFSVYASPFRKLEGDNFHMKVKIFTLSENKSPLVIYTCYPLTRTLS